MNYINIKLILIITFSVLYGFFEIFMSRRHQGKREISESGDKGSIWFLAVSISFGYWLSFRMASTRMGRIYYWNTLFIIGSVLVVIGLVIRVTSILALKKQLTDTVPKVDNHELIEMGSYKFIRQPGYLGQLIIFLGIAIALSNWISVLLMIIPVLSGYLYHINVEEKFMVSQMVQAYADYKTQTKKLLPGIF